MKFFNNLSIKNKLVTIVLATTLITIVIGLTIIIASNIEMFRNTLIREATLIADVTGDNCQGTLEFGLNEEATKFLENLRKQEHVKFACLYDENGVLFSTYKQDLESNELAPMVLKTSQRLDGTNLHIYNEISDEHKIYGTIYLRVSTEQLDEQINQYLLIVLILTIVLTIISGIAAFKLQSIISKPILELADTAIQISKHGDYSVRINRVGSDEIATLYDGFNNMLNQIQKQSTDRDKIEKALRESENRLQTITAISPVGIYRNNDDGELIWGNQKTLELTGLSLVEAAGRGWENNIHKDDRANFDKQWYSAINAQRPFTEEFRFEHSDGTIKWVLGQSVAEYDSEGAVKGFVGTMTDISDRKEFEQALKESEEYNRMLFDLSPIGLIVLKLDGDFVDLNEAFSKLIGIPHGDLLKLNYWSLTVEKYICDEKGYFNNLLNIDNYGPYKKEFIDKRNNNVPTVVTGGIIELHNISYIIASVEDITKQMKLSEEKEALEIQLIQQQKLESIGTLASGVAHEINNPLMGIINYATLINKRVENESLKTFSEGIVYEGERVAKIVRNLLSFAHQEKESSKLTNVTTVIENSLSLLRASLRKDSILLFVNIEDELPDVNCKGNQIEQVIINLITNARDALNSKYQNDDENKKLNLNVFNHRSNEGEFIKVIVEDFGSGISDDTIHRIFDPFFTTKPRDKGTGLGLSISYGILKDHNCKLEVETEPGKYTRFSFVLKV